MKLSYGCYIIYLVFKILFIIEFKFNTLFTVTCIHSNDEVYLKPTLERTNFSVFMSLRFINNI